MDRERLGEEVDREVDWETMPFEGNAGNGVEAREIMHAGDGDGEAAGNGVRAIRNNHE